MKNLPESRMLDDNGEFLNSGWISPDGIFYPCTDDLPIWKLCRALGEAYYPEKDWLFDEDRMGWAGWIRIDDQYTNFHFKLGFSEKAVKGMLSTDGLYYTMDKARITEAQIYTLIKFIETYQLYLEKINEKSNAGVYFLLKLLDHKKKKNVG